MMALSEEKARLMIYKTYLDNEKFQLAELLRRHSEEEYIFPKELWGDPAMHLDQYTHSLQSAIDLCDVLRSHIVEKLNSMK